MKGQAGVSVIAVFIFTLVGGIVVLTSTAVSAAEESVPQVLEAKKFERWPDPVVADCGLFSSLLGKRIEFLRLYAYGRGSFYPIPFQIDEKDSAGELVLTSGEKANPEDADGLLGKGEELVFMARDSGDRVNPRDFIPGIRRWEEIVLQDPLTKGKGWVYLLYDESKTLPFSAIDYITYIPVYKEGPNGDCLYMKTKYFENEHYPQAPYFDTNKYTNVGFAHRLVAVYPEAGGTGVDFCDRFKVRVTVAFLFGLLKYHVDENKMTFHEHAYKDGPVRLIRNNQIILSLPLGLKAPGAAVNVIYYETLVNVPLIIDIPFNPGYLYTYLEISVTEDHSREAIGMKVYSSNNFKGCIIDGVMKGEAETHWNKARDEWRLITGEQGTMMNRSIWDERYLKQMKAVSVEYIDDMNMADPPEEEPGVLGQILQKNRVEGIKKERYFSYLEWYYPPAFLFSGPERTYQVGDEQIYLNIADNPVRLKVGDLAMESHYFGPMPDYEKAGAAGAGDVTEKE